MYPIKYRVNIVWEISETIIFGNFPKLLITSSFSLFVKFPIVLQWETSQSFLSLSPPNRKIPKPMFWEVSYILYFLTLIYIGNFPIPPPCSPLSPPYRKIPKPIFWEVSYTLYFLTPIHIGNFPTSPPYCPFETDISLYIKDFPVTCTGKFFPIHFPSYFPLSKHFPSYFLLP